LGQGSETSIPQRCELHRKLAESYLALGRREDAVAQFELLLQDDPGYRLGDPSVSPKIQEALHAAGERRRAREPRPPWVELGLDAGAQFLFGNDRGSLDTGWSLELGAQLELAGPFRVGAGLLTCAHEISGNDRTLREFGGWVGAGAGLWLGPVALSGLAGLGGGWFGVLGEENQSALLVPLRLRASVQVFGPLRLGATLAPSWLITFSPKTLSSFVLAVYGHLAAAF
jgi:hypothetical protein